MDYNLVKKYCDETGKNPVHFSSLHGNEYISIGYAKWLESQLAKSNDDLKLTITELDNACNWVYPQYSDELLVEQKSFRMKLIELVKTFKKVYGI